MPGITTLCENCHRVSHDLALHQNKDEYWCESCFDDADEAAWERQQERNLESPPETSREEYIRTWEEKQRLRR